MTDLVMQAAATVVGVLVGTGVVLLYAWWETRPRYACHQYSRLLCWCMNRLDPRVHDDCEWVAPYGFVPSAWCPKHGDGP